MLAKIVCRVRPFTALLVTSLMALPLLAHPGSGIVVDGQGRVYFVHAQVGTWMVGADGALGYREGPAYHFLILDRDRSFAKYNWPRFPDGEIEVVGSDPALLHASSFPVTIAPDGALYYPEAVGDGPVQIMRTTPSGPRTVFATLPVATEIDYEGKPVQAKWIHGLAAGRDGALYYTEKQSVRRIGPDGSVSLVAGDIVVPDCERPSAITDDRGGPVLRGIDVADDGSVYVAAAGCSALLKITPDGAVSVALRSTDSWAPTGVAVVGDSIYVLEYKYIPAERARDWLPRVRKLSPNGVVGVIAEVTADELERRLLRSKADGGDADAQYELGTLYYRGEGVGQDFAEAAAWYRKAAEQGLADAQFALGEMYAVPLGVPKDPAAVVEWFRRAAEQGHAQAQMSLAGIHAEGRGVEQDLAEAAKWYRKAAEQGVAEGQFMLGHAYYSGRGVQQDLEEARKWYGLAAEQGLAEGQAGLAWMYYKGRGLDPDPVRAYMWCILSADGGIEGAADMIESMNKEMTPEQIAEARRLAEDWKAGHGAD
ncbi:MAG: hypothetical protein AMXMBFR4_03790 [Candidatus Hydrogenedentota bacterium]